MVSAIRKDISRVDRNKGKLQRTLLGCVSFCRIFHEGIIYLRRFRLGYPDDPQIFNPGTLICQIAVQQIYPLSCLIRIHKCPGSKLLQLRYQACMIRMLMGNKNIQLSAINPQRIDHAL